MEGPNRLGPSNGSFQAMVTAMREMWGEDKTREWLLGIQANSPKVYPKNTPQVAAAAAGEIDVGLVNHYYLHRFIQEDGEDFPARNYHPRDGGPGSLVLVAGAGILETAENRDNAERFLKFMLSKVGQQYFAGQTFEYPLVEGSIPAAFLRLWTRSTGLTRLWCPLPISRDPETSERAGDYPVKRGCADKRIDSRGVGEGAAPSGLAASSPPAGGAPGDMAAGLAGGPGDAAAPSLSAGARRRSQSGGLGPGVSPPHRSDLRTFQSCWPRP